jgi:hypothetical protein
MEPEDSLPCLEGPALFLETLMVYEQGGQIIENVKVY